VSDIAQNIIKIKTEIPANVKLIAVSKTHPAPLILEAYRAGLRDFGENKVQELTAKAEQLPPDIHWHLIGHLQTNKVKYIAPFVHLIHAVDSLKLLTEIDKRALQHGRIINVLLQVHIASEETKFGLNILELEEILETVDRNTFKNVSLKGLMGMATNTDDSSLVHDEFSSLFELFNKYGRRYNWDVLSMGMSSDYPIAIACGSNMIRVGSAIFGNRNYNM
jgi:pyridoxal phosphate enzyme (YggS family)